MHPAEVAENLARVIRGKLVFDSCRHAVARQLGCVDLRGGDIGKADAACKLAHTQAAEKVILLIGEQVGLNERARGNHTDDVPSNQSLCKRGIFHLLADCDLIPFLDEFSDILVNGVERNAAHRGALLLAAVPPRKGKIQFSRRDHRVVKKHFVEVPETVKQQIVLILVLDLEVLLHHRRHGISPFQG